MVLEHRQKALIQSDPRRVVLDSWDQVLGYHRQNNQGCLLTGFLISHLRPKLLFFLYMNTQMGRGLVCGYRHL
jgi:hypothetical protein